MTTRDTAPSLFDLFPDDPTTTGEPTATKRIEPGEALAAAALNLAPLLASGHRLAAPVVTTAVHDAWPRRRSRRPVLELEALLRRRRGRDGAVHAALGTHHALARGDARGVPRHGRAGRGAGANPLAPLRAPGRLRPVLDAAGARLRGLSGGTGANARHRAGAVCRHGGARGPRLDGARRRCPPAPQRTLAGPARAAREHLPAGVRHEAQRRAHPRPAPARASERRAHEPAVRGATDARQAPAARGSPAPQVRLRRARPVRAPGRRDGRQLHPRLDRLARHARHRRGGAAHPVRHPCAAHRLPPPRHRRRDAPGRRRTRPGRSGGPLSRGRSVRHRRGRRRPGAPHRRAAVAPVVRS